MDIKTIQNEEEYTKTLQKINKLMDATPNTKEFEELDGLITLVEDYERIHYSFDDGEKTKPDKVKQF